MLVLSRNVGQSLVLDDRITVTVLATRGTLVRLGVEAASDIGVRRAELVVRAEAADAEAGPGSPP
jgi:carbon storage regulator